MIYILLVNWNNWADTLECLESVFRCDYEKYTVIVCDNNSNDGSVTNIKAWAEGRLNILPSKISNIRSLSFPPSSKPIKYVEYFRQKAEHGGDALCSNLQLVIINIESNLGFAGGNNVGLRYALANDDFLYVWLLNNDTVISHDALRNMVKRIEQSDKIGMIGSTLLNYIDGFLQSAGGGKYNKITATVKPVPPDLAILPNALDYVSAASMLISKRFIHEVGLLCEDYFLYFEELDLAFRGERLGYSISYAPDSIVYHKGGASIGSGKLADYFAYRNKVIFTRKYLRNYIIYVYIIIILSAFTKLITGKLDRFATIIRVLLDLVKPERATSI